MILFAIETTSSNDDFESGLLTFNDVTAAMNMYGYDEIGNLTKDVLEGITNISWTASGKIKSIEKGGKPNGADLEFQYDALGHRISKTLKPKVNGVITPPTSWTETIYVRDATGNVLSTYTRKYEPEYLGKYTELLEQTDLSLYGSDRLGIYNREKLLSSRIFTTDVNNFSNEISSSGTQHFIQTDDASITKGDKNYELKNHLGNVLAVVSDAKEVVSIGGLVTVTEFIDLFTESPATLWYSTNEAEVQLALDAVAKQLTVVTSEGSEEGIIRDINWEVNDAGCTDYEYCFKASEGTILSLYNQDGEEIQSLSATGELQCISLTEGELSQLKFHHTAGAFILSYSELRKICPGEVFSYFKPILQQRQDYYPFGSQMPGRSFSSGDGYRYGFNGQERDDEISGDGNSMTAEYWQYDTRLGRRWNIDPVDKVWESPYAAFRNNPILFKDPNGDDVVNGDRLVANEKKAYKERSENILSEFRKEKNINDQTKRKDFRSNGGNRKDWRKFKKLKEDVKKKTKEYNSSNRRANITEGIINNWKSVSPNLFDEVDKQTTDFVLKSFRWVKGETGNFGSTKPSYNGDSNNAEAPSSMIIKIPEQVNLSSIDPESGEFSLNHEAGHFLYITLFTAEYIRYYIKTTNEGTYVKGGHGSDDESGKVATKLGGKQDIPKGPLKILPNGN